MFYTWGCLDTPTFICPPIHSYTPCMFVCPQGVHAPHMPPYSSMPLFLEALHVVGGCNGLPFMLGHPPLHHPCLGVPPLYYTPTLSHWFPCIGMFQGYQYVMWGISLLSGRVWGCFPISWGGWGSSALEMSICSFLYLFCSALCLMF